MTSAAALAPAHEVAARQLVARVQAARGVGLAARRRAIPRSKPPLLIESDYAARLVGIVDQMRAAARHLLDALPGILRADGAGERADADPGRAARNAMERVRQAVDASFDPHAFERVAAGFGERVAGHQKEQLGAQVKAALGVDVMHLDRGVQPLIQGFVHENVSLIRSLQGRTLDSLETLVTRAAASGLRAEHIQGDIASRFGIEERHARLIARDQIGKLNGQITAARHQEIGIKKFAWLSMLDNKVRPEHRALHGQVFAYDKLPAEGLPGTPICCRCVPEPIFDDVHAELGDAPAKAPAASPAGLTVPDGFDTALKPAGVALFDGVPDVLEGIPTYRQAVKTPYRETVYVTRPSEVADKNVLGIDTGGDKPDDQRTASILKAWRAGKSVPVVEIDVSRDGHYFIADGNHRVWAAIFDGDRPIAVRFRPVHGDVKTMDKVAGRMRAVARRGYA